MDNKQYTLITGGSEGIGLSFAIECASRNHNLILVAIDKKQLEIASGKILEKFTVDLKLFVGDLSDSNVVFSLYDWCSSHKLKINFLINNVGIGSDGSFITSTASFYLKQLNLNNNTLVLLTRLFYNNLKENSPSFILNMSSLGAYQPMPFKAVYAASKTFVYYFSRALAVEFKEQGIHVAVVLPGPVITNSTVLDRIQRSGFLARKSVLTSEEVVKKSLNQIFKSKHVIIPGFINNLLYFFGLFIPINLKSYFIAKEFKQ